MDQDYLGPGLVTGGAGDKLPGRVRHRRRSLGLGQTCRRVGGRGCAGRGGAAWLFSCFRPRASRRGDALAAS
jgi:hypothetical protein